MDLTKSLSSNTVLLDDMEKVGERHKLVMDAYNGAAKSTVERGEEQKLAGQIISFNITEQDKLLPKEDEGRVLLHHFPGIEDEYDFDEQFEHKVEHQEAMKSKGAPHDYHAAFGAKNFQQEPGERSIWQESHKEAMRILRSEGVTYGARKLASYAQALAYFILTERAVEEADDPRCHQLWVQAVKDRQTFLSNYLRELESTNEEVRKMMEAPICKRGCPSCTCLNNTEPRAPEQANDINWEDVEDIVIDAFDKAEVEDEAEVRKVLMLHNKKNGTQNLPISHTNAKSSFLKKTWSELGLPKKHPNILGPKSKTFVKKMSKVLEAEGGCKGENTHAVYCYQMNVQHFSLALKERILKHFGKQEIISEDTETAETQSQDFREYFQSQSDQVHFCKLCQFKAGNVMDLKEHVKKDHCQCKVCKKYFCTERDLHEHTKSVHMRVNCTVCKEKIPVLNLKTHMNSHKEKAGFKRVLEDVGKIRKTTDKKQDKVDLRVAYRAYSEEKKAETRVQVDLNEPDVSAREKSQLVNKMMADGWKKKSAQQKEDYAREKIVEAERRKGEQERGENIINLVEDDQTMDRITKCQECGKVCLGEQQLMRHNIETHGDLDEQMYLMDDDLEELVFVEDNHQDASLEEKVPQEKENNLLEEVISTENENTRKKSQENEQNPSVELVLVQYLKRQWPAKVIERTDGKVKIQRFDKNRSVKDVTETSVTPFVYDTRLFETSNNSELTSAFKKAQKIQQAMALFD